MLKSQQRVILSFGNVTLKNILFEEALIIPFPYSTKLFTKRPFFHALKIFRIRAIRQTKIEKHVMKPEN